MFCAFFILFIFLQSSVAQEAEFNDEVEFNDETDLTEEEEFTETTVSYREEFKFNKKEFAMELRDSDLARPTDFIREPELLNEAILMSDNSMEEKFYEFKVSFRKR
jgi:hypothetical protein